MTTRGCSWADRARNRRLARRAGRRAVGLPLLQLMAELAQLVAEQSEQTATPLPAPAPPPPPLRQPGVAYAISNDPGIIGAHEVPALRCPSCDGVLPWALVKGWR